MDRKQLEETLAPEVISAQQAMQTALDKALLEKLQARRDARKEKKNSKEEFPASLERRIRILDLSEEQKVGLKLLGTKITERLRFRSLRSMSIRFIAVNTSKQINQN